MKSIKYKTHIFFLALWMLIGLCSCVTQPENPAPLNEADLAITAEIIKNTLLAPLTQTAENEFSAQQTQTAVIENFIQQITKTAQVANTNTPQPTQTSIIILQPTVAPAPQGERMRIMFAAGAISTSIHGRVLANSINYYVLRAMKGQTMTVNVISAQGQAFLTIYGLTDGIPIVRGSASGATYYQGVLPLTQDYAIDIVSDGTTVDYVMQITIR